MRKKRLVCEINVTPLIDVMLVLLVIFMVTAPLLHSGLNVQIPQAKSSVLSQKDEPIVLNINTSGEIFIGEMKVSLESLQSKLSLINEKKNENVKIYVKGDKNASYGVIASILGELTRLGYTKIVLITESK